MYIENKTFNLINFKKGLTKNIILQEKFVNVKKTTDFFSKNNIETNFLENKSASLANSFCLSVFEQLSNKLGISIKVPPAIYIYEKNLY